MLYRFRHRLSYCYASQATLGPQVLRLRPREDGSQRLLDWNLEITPQPNLLVRQLDANGNVEARAWFLGSSLALSVQSEGTVETLRVNPFDFIVDEEFRLLPQGPALLERNAILGPFLAGPYAPAAAALAAKLSAEAGFDSMGFLLRLNRWLFEHLAHEHRATGEAWEPDKTLAEQRGACRDLAQLFLACVRSLGMPGRFVSGYFEGDPEQRAKDLHAWAEVYLPGGGWRGFDPSTGLACGERHVALASGATPDETAALSGGFSSALPGASMEAEVLFL